MKVFYLLLVRQLVLTIAALGPAYNIAIAESAQPEHGILGITTGTHNVYHAKKLGYPYSVIYARSVINGSPAQNAGIKKGDILIKFANIYLKSEAHLKKLVLKTKPNQKITMIVGREDKKKYKINVTMGSREDFFSITPFQLEGSLAPEIKAKDIKTERTIKLSELRGSPTLIMLFKTEKCKECSQAISALMGIRLKHRKKNLKIFPVTTDTAKQLEKFYKLHVTPFYQLYLPEDSLDESYHTKQMPLFLLVDNQGYVKSVGLGLSGLTALDKMLSNK